MPLPNKSVTSPATPVKPEHPADSPAKVGPVSPPANLQSAMDAAHARIDSLKNQLVDEQSKLDNLIYRAHKVAQS